MKVLPFFLLFPFFLLGQNLVPNSSFEQLINLPVKPNPRNSFEFEPQSGYKPFQINLKYWWAGTNTTPDLRITDRESYGQCNRRFDDCDKAKTGSMCIGIITSMANTYTESYREYIEVKLGKPLEVNKPVFVELWVRRERQSKLVSNNIGCYFSQKKVFKDTEEVMDLKPQINHENIINEEKTEWVKIEGNFVPQKPFQYLTIGNFFDNQNTEIATFDSPNLSPYIPKYAYYLVDDVKVWQEDVPTTSTSPTATPVFNQQKVEKNKAIVLNKVYFDWDKAILKPASFLELDALVAFLEEQNELKIAIHGHTDNTGTEQYNAALSGARAKAVRDYLVEKGVSDKRLTYKGFGELKPVEENATEQGRGQNRRVEFVVMEK